MAGKDEVLKVFQQNNVGGLISESVLLKAGLAEATVRQLLQALGTEALPFSTLVDWLWTESIPGERMAPQPLAAAPSDNRAELALQTLALLAAAASWALKGGDGELRVENTPSTPEAFQGFTVAFLAKDNSTLDESVAFASQLSKMMEELLLSSVQLELLPREEALSRICFDNCRAFASSARCSSMALYKVALGAGVGAFYTPAAAPVAQLSSCQVPWKLEALAPGRFKLLGPSLNLSALVPGHFAKLGAPLPLDVGIQECNAAAEAGQQTNMALQAETLQNNTLSELSTRIADAARQKSCVVVVAGPSSSGKTTFSARLALHLQARGVDARPLECDMYFKARADPTHPRDAKGELNFEDPGSLRIHKVKEDLEALMAGKPVELPKFCFKTGEPSRRRRGTSCSSRSRRC
ncbi:unnamed protein product [Effrenium voratum]|uniref:Phosphoribulokinase/uridine kinase domain-containing protein n=1 Tax=Effrenium voratum TaxID=2562239 RepID=A0AA36MQ55_9DINO|nr:unnamed protein product [Effrenium voratum]